jgi:glycosyltransferase involved in cell wall biosynthesis
MARIGINPTRGKFSDYQPAEVTVTVLTYIPGLSGYFQERLEVLQLVLSSLIAHTTSPHDLLVLDNGSCREVVDYLRSLQVAGELDYLILSRQNLGKIGALRLLCEAAPGDLIAYCDDDIFFYPGWLEAQLEILHSFPQAGMVSGLPVRNAAHHARQSLENLTQQNIPGLSITYQRRIPDEWEADWAISTGRDPEAHLQDTQDHQDVVLRIDKRNKQGIIEAIGSANHFQFVSPKQVLHQALPKEWSGKLMGHMVELDQAVDVLGYLRLSTMERYTRHLGNTLSKQIIQEAQAMGLSVPQPGEERLISTEVDRPAHRNRHWLLRVPGARRVLIATYKRLFDILYHP